MNRFWDLVICPALEKINANTIVEIGCAQGINTRNILRYCKQRQGKLYGIDPAPGFDVQEWKEEFGSVFEFYQELSLSALPLIDEYDAVLIDGDHNWYTVYNELKIIEKKAEELGKFPVVFLHDIGWPYGRRDAYYNPELIPDLFRQPNKKLGLIPGQSLPAEEGGLNPHLYHSIYENNLKNGVFTAIEDFLKDTPKNFNLLDINAFFGMAIIGYSGKEMTCISEVVSDAKNILYRELERERITFLVEKLNHQRVISKLSNQFVELKKDNARLLEEQSKFKKELNETFERLQVIKENNKELCSLKRKLIETQKNLLTLKETHALMLQEKINTENQLKELNVELEIQLKEIDKLSRWIEQLTLASAALLNSKRWRIGHFIGECFRLILFKKRIPMASDLIFKINTQFSVWEKNFRQKRQANKKPVNMTPGIYHSSDYLPNCCSLTTKVPKKRIKISVICWEVSHNPVGRAFLLADILSKDFDVEIIGANFAKYGSGIWEPIKGEKIPIVTFEGKNFPMHFWKMRELVEKIDGDVIYVSKPRLPSFEMGVLLKYYKQRPIILDIDDYELSFFNESSGITLDQVKQLKNEEDFWTPYGKIWTRYCESIISCADYITVSNIELQKKYGGTIIPHARDESIFDPVLYDREAIRAELEFTEKDKVIIFIGTPRLHKGVLAIVEALENLGNPNYKLCIVGTLIDSKVRERLKNCGGDNIKLIPNQPFSQLPKYLVIGDLYCILQEQNSEISKYQMPAKFTDALAMGIPVLTTNVPPMLTLSEEGLVELLGDMPLEAKIDDIFKNYEIYKQKAIANREAFLSTYSYGAAEKQLKNIINNVLENTSEIPPQLKELIEFHKENFSSKLKNKQSLVSTQNVSKINKNLSQINKVDDKYDIVFFWKQNDTGIYGRRQDMLVKYLSQSSEVNQILHFDAPIEVGELWAHFKNRKDKFSHSGAIFYKTVSRIRGNLNTDKVKYYTFIYKSNSTVKKLLFPTKNKYYDYIAKILEKNKIGQRKTIFWVCPKNFDFPQIVESFGPEFIIADVIDDHRAWFNEENEYVKKLTQNYKDILEISDLVFVNCQKVKESMLAINNVVKDKIYLIPNACEFPDNSPINNYTPCQLKNIQGPIIGYVGNLSTKIDVELLEHVAISRPNWNIVLIGSTHSRRDILRLNSYDNVHFLGVIEYEHVKNYIKNFDVAIIPHRNIKLTQSMNPLKLFVYCAMNKPVVSTEIDNINELRDMVSIANNKDDFIKEIELALKKEKNGKVTDDVMELLKRNSWNERVNKILKLIKDKF